MAIAFVKSVGSASGKAVTSVTVTVPAGGVASGNLLIAYFAANATTNGVSSVTDATGNVWSKDGSFSSLGTSEIWSTIATTAYVSGNTIKFNAASSALALVIAEFSGAAQTLDGLPVHANGATATATPTVTGDLAVADYSERTATAGLGAAMGWTLVAEPFSTGGSSASNIDLAAQYQLPTGTSSVLIATNASTQALIALYQAQVAAAPATALIARHRQPPPHYTPPQRGGFMVAFPRLWTPRLWLPAVP